MSQKWGSMETELFHADRQTDMTKLKVAFLNVRNARDYKTHVHTCWIL